VGTRKLDGLLGGPCTRERDELLGVSGGVTDGAQGAVNRFTLGLWWAAGAECE
jgi:hypothetical protein